MPLLSTQEGMVCSQKHQARMNERDKSFTIHETTAPFVMQLISYHIKISERGYTTLYNQNKAKNKKVIYWTVKKEPSFFAEKKADNTYVTYPDPPFFF